jgi:hypothetical protein
LHQPSGIALLLNSFIALIRIAQILLVNAICFLLRFNSFCGFVMTPDYSSQRFCNCFIT